MSNDANKGYQFTVQNGIVTAVYEVKNGRAKFDKMDADEAWSYDLARNQVTKTEFDHGRLETTVYSDTDGNGIFSKTSKTEGAHAKSDWEHDRLETTSHSDADDNGFFSQNFKTDGAQANQSMSLPKGYQFTIVDGVVTALFKVEHGVTQSKAFEFGETWSVAGNQVIKTEVEHGRTETSIYADLNSDGIFNKISETFVNSQTGVSVTVSDMASQYGSDGHDNLSGSVDNDDLYGGLGHDSFTGGDGDDYLYAGAGDDTVNAGNGDDSVIGNALANKFEGGAGDDFILAGAGNDILVGGLGVDILIGSSGADTFVFNSLAELGLGRTSDTVLDFNHSQGDKIDLGMIDANDLLAGHQSFQFLTQAPVTGDSTGTLWFDQGSLYLSSNSDVAAEYQIVLTGVTAFNVADLLVL